MNSYAIIRQAIVDKRQIVATYDGHRRQMCPHAIGTKNGRAQALFFQFGGSSSKGLPADGEWRCMPVDDLDSLEARNGPWITSSNYDAQRQTCIDVIDTAIR